MFIEYQERHGTVVARVSRSIETITDCQWTRDSLVLKLKTRPKRLVLDFAKLEFMTGSFCGFLVSVYKKCLEAGIELSICTPKTSLVRNILDDVGISQVVPVYETLDQCPGMQAYHYKSPKTSS